MNKYSQSDISRRRQEILRIVRERAVHSQEELLELLSRAEFHVTQPTLSRDVRELGLAKTARGYLAPEPTPSVVAFAPKDAREQRLNHSLEEFALSAEQAGTLIVLRTIVAGAQPLAVAIDSAGLPGVVGTIAGDDTVFLAVRTPSGAKRLTARLRESISPRRPLRSVRA